MLGVLCTLPYYTFCDNLALARVLHGFINQISSLICSLRVLRDVGTSGTQALDSSRLTNGCALNVLILPHKCLYRLRLFVIIEI